MAGMMSGSGGGADTLRGLLDFITNPDLVKDRLDELDAAEKAAIAAQAEAQVRLDNAKTTEALANKSMQAALDEQTALAERMIGFAAQMNKAKADLALLQDDLNTKLLSVQGLKEDALADAQAYITAKGLTESLALRVGQQKADLDKRELAIAAQEKSNADLKASLEAKIAKVAEALKD